MRSLRERHDRFEFLWLSLDPIVKKDRVYSPTSMSQKAANSGPTYLLHNAVKGEIRRMKVGERRYLTIPTFKLI